MKITILNGDMNSKESDFSLFIENLVNKLQQNHQATLYNLNKMNLHYCNGCWNCWWKTPGRCTTPDDADKIFESYINSDLIIFASPLMVGFTSSLLKKITDRLIVLLHPYIQLRNEESHHKKRYDKYPNFGLILEKETDTDSEDLNIVKDIYDRFALNFHCERKFMKFIDDDNIEETVNEINNI